MTCHGHTKGGDGPHPFSMLTWPDFKATAMGAEHWPLQAELPERGKWGCDSSWAVSKNIDGHTHRQLWASSKEGLSVQTQPNPKIYLEVWRSPAVGFLPLLPCPGPDVLCP